MGRFLRHAPCPHCGSRDAYALYADGSAWCWSCHTYDPSAYGGDGTGGYTKVARTLIPYSDLESKAIPARKISRETCETYGYALAPAWEGQPWHVAPYYRGGKLVAQHLRNRHKEFKWLGKAQGVELFGQKVWPPGSAQRVVLTEGEIDAMSLGQTFGLKVPCLSIPSGTGSASQSIKDNLQYLNSFPEVVLAFDNDEPGRKATEDVVHLFRPGVVKLFQYLDEGFKDPNDFLRTGQARKLIDGVLKAVPYRPDGIISGIDLWDSLTSPPRTGYTTPYPKLNALFNGLRKGELYLFTAGSGIGKSTLVREISYHFLTHHNLALGVVALEENKRLTAEHYVGLHLNRNLRRSREGITMVQLEKAFRETVGSERFWLYDHWGSTDLDGLLSKLRYMAVGLGVDWIILDHISIVVSGLDEIGESERRMIDKLMTRLRSLLEETGVGLLAIVHLKRKQEGRSFNEGGRVSLTDLRGSGALEQLSDGVVALERDQQGDHADVATIRVLKNRPFGETGVADTLRYDRETGRLLSDDTIGFTFQTYDGGGEPPF